MNQLTEEQVNDISKTLEENKTEQNKELENMPSNSGVEERTPEDPKAYEQETVHTYVDPLTGERNNIPESIDPLSDINLDSDGFDKLLNMTEDEIKLIDISDDEFKTHVPVSGLNKTELAKFREVFDKYRNGENISYYNSLPNKVKKFIDEYIQSMCLDDITLGKLQDMRSVLCQTIFDEIIQNVYQDKAFTDLDKSINEAYKDLSKSITSETNMDIRHKILSFTDIANKIREENPEKAEQLDKFVESYNYARDYEPLIKAVKTGKLRAKKIEIEKFNRVSMQYDNRYVKSNKIIDTISNLPFIISRHIDCSLDDAKRIVIAYVKYIDYAKLNIDKLQDYCFMYYFTKNIIGLDNYDKSVFEELNYYTNIEKNLKILLNEILSVEDNIVNKK